MRADFAGLFEDVDVFGGKLGLGARFVVLADQSSQMQGASKSGGPGADDQHVRVQPLAFGAHGFDSIPLRLHFTRKLATAAECYFFSRSSVRAGMSSKISPTMP